MRPKALLRGTIGAALLAAILWLLDPAEIAARVRGFEPLWLVAALALGALHFALSAERWRLTSRRLGLPLGRRRALCEYWLAGFANQTLPGGVLGDAGRAWRHSSATGRTARAVHAVVLERASGQVAVAMALVATLALTAPGRELLAQVRMPTGGTLANASGADPTTAMLVAIATGLVIAATLVIVGARLAQRAVGTIPAWLRRLGADARTALLSRRALPGQLLLSLAAVAACCAMFACAGRMIGAEVPLPTLLAIAPAVLVSMLVPITIAGWGVREAAAAAIWTGLGLPAAEGVAVSIAYGLLCLLASLPGAAVVAAAPAAQRG